MRRRRGVRPAGKTVGLTKERRTQIADRLGEIDVVENVSRGNAERQIVTIVACAAIHAAVAPKTGAAHASVAMTARNGPGSCGTSGNTASSVRRLPFLA